MTRIAGLRKTVVLCAAALAGAAVSSAEYVNFESSHVHPVGLTPSGTTLLAVNTPDALLEVFDVLPGGALDHRAAIPVGLEPVTVVARTDTEAWVVNNLSDTVSVVDLAAGVVERTLAVGNEPTDVVFAAGKAFVAVSEEDAVKVFDLGDLSAAPTVVPLHGRDVRALDVSSDGSSVYAVVLRSGNRTSAINALVVTGNTPPSNPAGTAALGLRAQTCEGVGPLTPPAPRPPLPNGVTRNPSLPVPSGGNPPNLGLIVHWNDATSRWEDEEGTDWSHCLQYRPADNDLFVIDAGSLTVTEVKGLGTILFDVSVHPSGRIYVPHTEARNYVPASQHPTQGSGRFEHPAGVRGRVVDNRLAIVDPSAGFAVTHVDLNDHVDRSVVTGPLAEREASISQPGMLAWKADGSAGFMTAIGSRRVFRVAGACLAPGCIVGATRTAPDAVEVGDGPSGIALLEDGVAPGTDRLFVLNRIAHSIALVDASGTTLTKIDEIPLHDPSTETTRAGRRFLYDAIDTSGHGDASCASCHVSGDTDLLSWELGNPEDAFTPYSTPFDNVRFIDFDGTPCDPDLDPDCAVSTGFDPQKGPMTTQTLRGMQEPLHWRGDRPTLRDFNGAFHALMGAASGLSPSDLDDFRDFALGIATPPNPYRQTDDTIAAGDVQLNGMLFPGDPAAGDALFHTAPLVAGGSCTACHSGPRGSSGGVLGGLEPTEPTSPLAPAMVSGVEDQAAPNDLQVPHLRNVYEKFGPVWAAPGPLTCGTQTAGLCDNDPSRTCLADLDCAKPPAKTTFGVIHDGSIPDLYRFLTSPVFQASVEQVKDLVAFVYHFPSETKPAVGRQVTVPAGTAPTGTPDEESLLTTLVALGDRADGSRHCELVATTRNGGRLRGYHLDGSWVTDLQAETPITLATLRQNAQSEITFTCATIGSGPRLGTDRDEDGVLNGDDCGPADPGTLAATTAITDLSVTHAASATTLTWTDQAPVAGSSVRYRVVGGPLTDLPSQGLATATCIEGELTGGSYLDARPTPSPGDGVTYLVIAENACGGAILGAGRDSLLDLTCP